MDPLEIYEINKQANKQTNKQTNKQIVRCQNSLVMNLLFSAEILKIEAYRNRCLHRPRWRSHAPLQEPVNAPALWHDTHRSQYCPMLSEQPYTIMKYGLSDRNRTSPNGKFQTCQLWTTVGNGITVTFKSDVLFLTVKQWNDKWQLSDS